MIRKHSLNFFFFNSAHICSNLNPFRKIGNIFIKFFVFSVKKQVERGQQ